MSQLIFSSPDNLAKSSQLQNAIIRQELETRRDQLAKTEAIFFMDIPLLIEQNYRDWFDEIWLIAVSPETQIKRLKQRNGYSQEEAQQRLASQMPLQAKKIYADQIIDNNKTVENTKMQVDSQLRRLQNE